MHLRRPLAVAAVACVAALLPTGNALAHECFNASRSANGDAGADHSPQWETVQLAEFFADPPLGLSQAQQTQALNLAAARGIPSSFTIFVGNHTIGTRASDGADTPSVSRNGHSADGWGIDHIFDRYGAQLVQIVIDVGGTPPPLQ